MNFLLLHLLVFNIFIVYAEVYTIELAVFIDFYQWRKAIERFTEPQAEPFIKKFVEAVVGNSQILFHHPTLKQALNINVVKLDIWRVNPPEMCDICVGKQGPNGSAEAILDVFTAMMKKRKRTWDAAVLFTGLDTGKIQGIAHLSSICTEKSLTVVTGSFGAGSVLPHEIGHLLGMTHDQGSAMDPGLTRDDNWYWADISNEEMNNHLSSITARKKNCLRKNEYKKVMEISNAPATLFPANDQCHWNHDVLTNIKPGSNQICGRIQCERFLWLVVFSTINSYSTNQLALEGTACGLNGECKFGECLVKKP